jgi:hypothetical protein
MKQRSFNQNFQFQINFYLNIFFVLYEIDGIIKFFLNLQKLPLNEQNLNN